MFYTKFVFKLVIIFFYSTNMNLNEIITDNDEITFDDPEYRLFIKLTEINLKIS